MLKVFIIKNILYKKRFLNINIFINKWNINNNSGLNLINKIKFNIFNGCKEKGRTPFFFFFLFYIID